MFRITFTALFFLAALSGIPGNLPYFGAGQSYASEDLYESRLNSGLYNTDPYSYLLIKTADAENVRAKELLEKARKYSPDLPAVYFALAGESFSLSASGILESVDYLRQGISAYKRNFWWRFNLAGLLYISLIISYALSMLLIIAIRFPMDSGLISHDILEDKLKAVFILVVMVLSFLGPLAFIAVVLSIMGVYFKRHDKVVVYVSIVLLSLSPVILRVADTFLTAQSPELRAIVAVNEGRDNRYALWALKKRDDFSSEFSYATALKREGYYHEAIAVYKKLTNPPYKPDPRVYVNLGNAYYALKDLEAAKDSYKRSIELTPLPSAYYNLSQVYRETLDFVKGDEYFTEAARLNRETVSKFASLAGNNPNRFVNDESIPIPDLWKYAIMTSGGRGFLRGQKSEITTVVSIILAIVFYQVNKRFKYIAYRCERCGAISCNKCSRVLIWKHMCPECYRSLIKIDEMGSKERIAKLFSIYHSRDRKRRMTKILAYLLPGAAQIYSGNILSGLLFLWPFLFSLVVIVTSQLAFFGVFSFRHGWLTILAVASVVITYIVSVLYTRRGMHRGWL